MKALVIGGAGSTGVPIVHGLLQRGYQVGVLNRGVHPVEFPSEVERIYADPHWRENLTEAMEGKSYDLVIALYGRLRLIAEVMKGKTSRLVSVGGALATYKGWMTVTNENPFGIMEESPVPVGEDHFLARAPGVDHFSEQVRLCEDVVMQAHRSGYYNATHFRYPIVYGPRSIGCPEWQIIRRARDGRRQVIVPGGGVALLSRGYCDNVAHGLLLAVDNPTACGGQIYNISDEKPIAVREWIRALSRILNHDFEFIEIPFDLLPQGFRNAPTQALFRFHRVMDVTKIKEQLGYRDVVSTERALELTVDWYTRHPLPYGGEIEKNAGDPYDYKTEDRFIRIYKDGSEQIRQAFLQSPGTEVTWRHPYPHPKKKGDLR
jgi:nucleoside-diphosphate-sugar epimerase